MSLAAYRLAIQDAAERALVDDPAHNDALERAYQLGYRDGVADMHATVWLDAVKARVRLRKRRPRKTAVAWYAASLRLEG